MARVFVKAGADRLHAWAGWHESPKPMLPMSVPRAAFVHLSRALKDVTDVPVTAVGRINDPFVAARVIREGKADLIAVGRGLLADPEFANKAREGRVDEIRKCIGCCVCFDAMMSQIHRAGPGGVICAINPELGREGEPLLKPVEKGKKVLVIGGGPGGMEAARVASLKGHNVTLWERSGRLGGSLLTAAIPPHKEEIECLTSYLSRQMEINRVEVKLNKNATAEEVLKEKPDFVVVASGSKQNVPEIPGIDKANPVMAIDVLTGKAATGERVVLIGGGLIGVDVAEYLHQKGKKVVILTRQSQIGTDIGISTRWVTMMRIRESGIRMMTKVSYREIRRDGVLIEMDGKEMFIPADTIVISGGLLPDRELVEALKGKIPLQEVGDCIEPRKIKDAVHEGFEAALGI
jgi:2,4-dienoyl-CoA reductase (NADPH2)